MTIDNTKRIPALEPHVSNLLIVTGILYTLAAANTALVFVTEGYEFQQVSGPLLLLGLLASLLALLGIYSRALDDAPTSATVTGVLTSLALLAVLTLLAWGIGSRIGPLPDTPAPLAIVALILFISSFVLAGVTVLRSSIYTDRVGYLLIAEALALVLVIVIPVVVYQGTAPEEATIGIELTQAIIVLWAGMLTRGVPGPPRREGSVGA